MPECHRKKILLLEAANMEEYEVEQSENFSFSFDICLLR